MWDTGVEEEEEEEEEEDATNRRHKRIKLGDRVKDGILPSAPGFESNGCKDPTRTDSKGKEKARRLAAAAGPSHAERAGAAGGAARKKRVCKKFRREIENVVESDAATPPTAKASRARSETDADELESCTCQRVRAYSRKIKITCARTYMSWPFSNVGVTRRAHAGTAGSPEQPPDPSTGEIGDSPVAQNRPGSSSERSDDQMLPAAPSAHQLSHRIKERRHQNGEGVLEERNGKSPACAKSASHFEEAAASPAGLHSDASPTLSLPSRCGISRITSSCRQVNGYGTDSYTFSTPSPSALGLSDCETTANLSPMSSLFWRDGSSSLPTTPSSLPPLAFPPRRVGGVESARSASSPLTSFAATFTGEAVDEALFHCEEEQRTSWASSSDSDSRSSSLLLPQHAYESDHRFPPSDTRPFTHVVAGEGPLSSIPTERGDQKDSNEFVLPLMLSPVTSPQGPPGTRPLPHRPHCSGKGEEEEEEEDEDEDENEMNKDARKHQLLPGSDVQHINGSDEDDVEQGNAISERVSPDPQPASPRTPGALAEPCSSPSSDEHDAGAFGDEGTSSSETACSEGEETRPEAAAADPQRSFLDEFTAYNQDILLVDVVQDDPELFVNPPRRKLLKLRRAKVPEASEARPVGAAETPSPPRTDGASLVLRRRWGPVYLMASPQSKERSCRLLGRRRPLVETSVEGRQSSQNTEQRMACCTNANSKPGNVVAPPLLSALYSNGKQNVDSLFLPRAEPVPTETAATSATPLHNHIRPLMAIRKGPVITTPANMMASRGKKAKTYCRLYFSESPSCRYENCRFQHLPMEGDEKFCVDTLIRFTKKSTCLPKAGAVFTGYYQNNLPGDYFSMPVLLTLLWALLKYGMVSDILSVLRVSLAHKIVPSDEFLLALFNVVREKGLVEVEPELMQLTFKMASAGLVSGLSLDLLDSVKNTPDFQQPVDMNSQVSVSSNHKLSTSAPLPEYLNLSHSIVEIELCTKQEDWRRMGTLFRTFCQFGQHPNQVGRIGGRVVVALLTEGKDKLSLPFAAFAETMCASEGVNGLIGTFLGRIGVSLMLRYHKTHQWDKGRRVVEVLSFLKVDYSTLKGLIGNEDGASRCYLVTVATELFLLSGSLEGALNTLRDGIDASSRYGSLFDSHLRVCVDRQLLTVASNAVDFMLYKNLPVDHALLQTLLNKLSKQNHWARARELFRHSLSTGYYPDVSSPRGFMTLVVPCRLREEELALSLEMFIATNATDIFRHSEASAARLSITLKRTQSCESEYLAAACRVLSAARIPQPNLDIQYTAVNLSQDQVFTLAVSSARLWLHQNRLWANEVWAH
ncbi:Testis- and ovary-specific PAZ domain-containing protein 1 [Liparis tanakae]|uniref:Protein TOPAZ1 n=1 Tax=Liparis tanakae TaxID=230148 RepID=A0A4Z2GNL9_9TELE|nr:Testis- and ovary-specific PAZ domain-containing protein 1 [Liparis tanakae]